MHRQKNSLFFWILRDPKALPAVSLREWDYLLPLIRQAGILGRFYPQLAEHGLLEHIPTPILPHLQASAIIAAERERMIRWEVNRIQRALADTPIPVILLKGAAYVLAGLPCARGRLMADVDILVPEEALMTVERALRRQGWEATKLDEYDQQYYRRWMHELPPLRHRLRGTEVDVHHTILPKTSRLKPDPTKLWVAARSLGDGRLKVLAPADMVLHSAAHAFYDGDLSNSVRDLLDLHELLCHFGSTDRQFWEVLPRRARELDLERPLFYALRYTQRFLNTPIPSLASAPLRRAGPAWPTRMLMDILVGRTLDIEQPPRPATRLACWLLYIRSHWLRMPPRLLAGHLLHKARRHLQERFAQANQTGG